MSDHLPSAEVLLPLLRQYFEAPVDLEVARRLAEDLSALVSNRPRYKGLLSSYNPRNRHGYGDAWREDYANHRTIPSYEDLALFHAAITPGYPKPKPYCPIELVGVWQEKDRQGPRWTLEADGAFHTTQADHRDMTNWCVHRPARADGSVEATLRVRGATGPWYPLTIEQANPGKLTLRQPRFDGVHTYELVRAY